MLIKKQNDQYYKEEPFDLQKAFLDTLYLLFLDGTFKVGLFSNFLALFGIIVWNH